MHVGKVRKWALLSACAVMTMTGAATTAMSQEAEVEELIVTGSRIRQNPLEARTPIMNLSEADIERSGRTSVADYLGQLAITGSAINAANNTSGNLGFPPDGGGIGAGQAEVDLRNLTSKRTLVLVDGRRWISVPFRSRLRWDVLVASRSAILRQHGRRCGQQGGSRNWAF